jgi:hypothetical protein
MKTLPLVFPRELPTRLKQLLEGCLSIEVANRLTLENLYANEFVDSLFANP